MRRVLLSVAAAVAALALAVVVGSATTGSAADSYHDLSGVGTDSYRDL